MFININKKMLQSLRERSCLIRTYSLTSVLKKHYSNVVSEVLDYSKDEVVRDIERYRKRKVYKSNFIPNLFLGLFEPRVLEYPQIRTQEETDFLKAHRERTHNLLLHGIDFKEIESLGRVPREVLDLMRNEDLVGMKIKFGGQGLGYLESESTYMQESLSLHSALAKTVEEYETSGYQIMNLFGTKSQKDEYAPKILNGQCVFTLAHLEDDPWISSDSPTLACAAVKGDDNYVISGRKSLVYNANSADVLIVSAKTGEENSKNSYTLFMVDRNAEGVSVLEPIDKMGLKGTEISSVVFNKVVVPKDKIIGNVNEGNVIIKSLKSRGKLSNGAQCIGLMRKLINDVINHCIVSNHFGRPLHDYVYIKGKIGELICALHSAESMTYLMTGRADEHKELDVELESLIVKIFNSEALNFIIHHYVQLLGRENNNAEFVERILQDSFFFSAFDDPNNHLKAHLGSVGVKYTMSQMKKKTEKDYHPKNPLILKIGIMKLLKEDKVLHKYLHLALKIEASLLGNCVQCLNLATETFIRRHGEEIHTRVHELSLLAELVIIIYQLAGVLGRTSRSYCIGLRNSEMEVRAARNIAQKGYQRMLTIVHEINRVQKSEPRYADLGKCALDNRKFFSLHPAQPVRNKAR